MRRGASRRRSEGGAISTRFHSGYAPRVTRAFLELPNGLAFRIDAAGLLLGRHRTCDVQLADQTASRRHALLRIAPSGVELVVLGKGPVHVNEVACTDLVALGDGDRVRLPGLEASIRVEAVDESVPTRYCLGHGRQRFPIRAERFVVGTSAAAQVGKAGWPDEILVLRCAQRELYVEAAQPGATLNHRPLVPGEQAMVDATDGISYAGEIFRVELAEDGDASTNLHGSSPQPAGVMLHPLPRGGRVTFVFSDGERAAYLPGRRFKLIRALVAPPAPYVPGGYVPDAELVALVWDDDDEVGGRQDINVLLTRCRHDLVSAGIAANALLERAPGGGATRVLLAPGARVTTEPE